MGKLLLKFVKIILLQTPDTRKTWFKTQKSQILL